MARLDDAKLFGKQTKIILQGEFKEDSVGEVVRNSLAKVTTIKHPSSHSLSLPHHSSNRVMT
jgi:hypothetical protein